jgi:hypothetical protein
VPLRTRLAHSVATIAIAFLAFVAVGLTAPADSPFTIRIHAVFLALDLNVKVGTMHLRYHWSAIPSLEPTTKTGSTLL